MSAAQWYGLGFGTPFAILIVIGVWMWCAEEAGNWWRRQQPTLARLRCTLAGHAYLLDNGWVVCSRCGHAARDPEDSGRRLDTQR